MCIRDRGYQTHLAGAHIADRAIALPPLPIANRNHVPCFQPQYLGAVSYTHLYVYKRQILHSVQDMLWIVKRLGGNSMKKQVDFLSGLPMTMLGGVFLLLSFVLPRVGIALPIDPAWITVIVSGIPLLYLAVWRILHNPGISKISSALLITIAMFAASAIGYLFAAGEVACCLLYTSRCV